MQIAVIIIIIITRRRGKRGGRRSVDLRQVLLPHSEAVSPDYSLPRP